MNAPMRLDTPFPGSPAHITPMNGAEKTAEQVCWREVERAGKPPAAVLFAFEFGGVGLTLCGALRRAGLGEPMVGPDGDGAVAQIIYGTDDEVLAQLATVLEPDQLAPFRELITAPRRFPGLVNVVAVLSAQVGHVRINAVTTDGDWQVMDLRHVAPPALRLVRGGAK